jgi:N-acetylglucosaminyldiphosphoundecaprenol N-acetyl-beta-D-mannosaminyltransferase
MKFPVLETEVNDTSYASATEQIRKWAQAGDRRCVYAVNVHVIMEAHDSKAYREAINRADLVTPDGMPLVWMLRLKGAKKQGRVYGPTLMLHALEMAAQENLAVGLYGGTPEVLERLKQRMESRFPGLRIAYAYSPPFRPLTAEEDEEASRKIGEAGVRILFVGLGCPKQERWIDAHRGRIQAVMVGVGAAFDFHAGVKPQAPAWMQRTGMEWFFRLIHEPRRLAKRYLYNNPRFIVLAAADLLKNHKKGNLGT